MCDINCDVHECKHCIDDVCSESGSITISDMTSCIEVVCAYESPYEDDGEEEVP